MGELSAHDQGSVQGCNLVGLHVKAVLWWRTRWAGPYAAPPAREHLDQGWPPRWPGVRRRHGRALAAPCGRGAFLAHPSMARGLLPLCFAGGTIDPEVCGELHEEDSLPASTHTCTSGQFIVTRREHSSRHPRERLWRTVVPRSKGLNPHYLLSSGTTGWQW